MFAAQAVAALCITVARSVGSQAAPAWVGRAARSRDPSCVWPSSTNPSRPTQYLVKHTREAPGCVMGLFEIGEVPAHPAPLRWDGGVIGVVLACNSCSTATDNWIG